MCYVLPWGQICLLIIHQGCMKAKQGHIHTDRKGRRITHAKHGKDRKEAFLRKQCFSVRLLRLAAPLTGYKLLLVMYLQVGALKRKLLFWEIGVFCYLLNCVKRITFLKVLRVYRNIQVFPKCIFNTLVWWNSCRVSSSKGETLLRWELCLTQYFDINRQQYVQNLISMKKLWSFQQAESKSSPALQNMLINLFFLKIGYCNALHFSLP